MNAGTIRKRTRETLMANHDVVLRPVVFINTGEYFKNISRASSETGISIENIQKSCDEDCYIYDDKTFNSNVLFMYYDKVREIISEKYNLNIDVEEDTSH